jgi:hypothetical protein
MIDMRNTRQIQNNEGANFTMQLSFMSSPAQPQAQHIAQLL